MVKFTIDTDKPLKMKKSTRIAIMAVTLALAGASLYYTDVLHAPVSAEAAAVETQTATVVSKDGARHDFTVEIARTPVEQEVGLMYRKELAPGRGMLFEMGKPAEKTAFWMKNTLIPLDMIFIAEDGTIVKIHANATPQSLTAISSDQPVTGVLEIAGGEAEKMGIKAGDKVDYPYFK